MKIEHGEKGRASFKGELGIKVIRHKKPSFFQRMVDWWKTRKPK